MSKLYSTLFCGTKLELSDKLQAEEDVAYKAGMEKTMAMAEEEKIARFNEIMGR